MSTFSAAAHLLPFTSSATSRRRRNGTTTTTGSGLHSPTSNLQCSLPSPAASSSSQNPKPLKSPPFPLSEILSPAASAPILMGYNGFSSHYQSNSDFPAASRMLPFPDDNAAAAAVGGASNAFNFEGLDASGGLFPNRSKLLRPLEVLPPVGAQPTLFQKRAAPRHSSWLHNLGALSSKSDEGLTSVEDTGGMDMGRKRKRNFEDEMEELGDDISTMNYDSDDPTEKFGDNSNANSSVTVGDHKGKKKGMPAKNLMAERRRRKKLNDRLYMLRSVVPKISKSFNSWRRH